MLLRATVLLLVLRCVCCAPVEEVKGLYDSDQNILTEVSAASFNATIAESKLFSLVEFYASWCVLCCAALHAHCQCMCALVGVDIVKTLLRRIELSRAQWGVRFALN